MRPGDVGMHVQGGDDGDFVPDDLADGLEQVAFRVVFGNRGHRPVQRQQDAVQPTGFPQGGEEGLLENPVAVVGAGSAGHAAGRHQRDRPGPLCLADCQHAGILAVGSGQLKQILTVVDIGIVPEIQFGPGGQELTGLLKDSADGDAKPR